MNTDQFKQQLEEEKKRLLTQLERDGDKDKTTGDWQGASDDVAPAIDPNEAADQIEELVSNTPIVENLEERLRNVNDTLERIEKGTYGTCEKCGKEIPEERLKANPAATTCIDCAA